MSADTVHQMANIAPIAGIGAGAVAFALSKSEADRALEEITSLRQNPHIGTLTENDWFLWEIDTPPPHADEHLEVLLYNKDVNDYQISRASQFFAASGTGSAISSTTLA